MKIEIDLSDLFCEGEEPCDIQEAIRKEVVRSLTETLGKGIKDAVRVQTMEVLNDEMRKAVTEQMPAIIDDLMNAPFTPVDRYGSRGEQTTFRVALVKEINAQMVYKKTTYDSDRNAFTKAVDSILDENIKTFKAEMKRQVDTMFAKEVMQQATDALRQKLGFTK